MTQTAQLPTEVTKYLKPGVYRICGKAHAKPWVDISIGMSFKTHNTALATGQYEVSGTVKYDDLETTWRDDPKHSITGWTYFEKQKRNHYSGQVNCIPIDLRDEPVKTSDGIDNPSPWTDPNVTHKYTIGGSIKCKIKISDFPGLTLVVEKDLPAKKAYAVSGKIDIIPGFPHIRGTSLIPLGPSQLGRYKINGELRVNLCDITNQVGESNDGKPPGCPPECASNWKEEAKKTIMTQYCKCGVTKSR